MRRGSWVYALGALVALAPIGATSLVASTGCDVSNCNTDPAVNPPADYDGGTVSLSEGRKIFSTSAPDETHLNFNGGAQFRIFHKLGACPMHVEGWVSFSETGIKGGNEARPAGNMFEVLAVDDETITVRNDSCGDYWLRVVASDPVPGCGKGGAGGASGAAGAAGASGVAGASGGAGGS